MPQYRNPFDKGQLIILFNIKFPEDGWIDAAKIQQLEAILPPRQEIMIPDGAEECTLQRFEGQSNSRGNFGGYREAYRDDDDEEGGPRVQCASH